MLQLRPVSTRLLARLPYNAVPRMAFARLYSIKGKRQQINRVLDKIGDENSSEAQKTLKIFRTIGGVSVIVVLCSLLWASSLSAPVKETPVEVGDLSRDVRK